MKKTKATKALWVVGAIAALGLVTAVVAGPDLGGAFANKRISKALDLSEKQEQQWKDISFEAQEKSIDIQADMKKAQLQLRHEMDREDPDASKIMNLANEIGKAQTELKKIQLKRILEARKILTPEQREKAGDLMAKWHAQRARARKEQRAKGPAARMQRPGRKSQGPREAGRPGVKGEKREMRERLQRKREHDKGPHSLLFNPDHALRKGADFDVANLPEPDHDFE